MFNLPNILTLSRIAAVPVVIALLYVAPPLGNWLAFSVYVLAAVTDFLDGYLARAWSQQSALGRFMDPIADKLLVGGLLLALVAVDRIAGWTVLPALVILGREILVSGLREFLAELRVSVPVSTLAKWKTTIQILALGFLIVGPAGPVADTTDVGVFLLWGAAALTMITGYDYFRAGIKHMKETGAGA